MQVLVRAKDFPVTQAIQSFAERQAAQLRKRNQRLIRIETFLEQTRSTAKATVKAVVPGQDIVVVKSAKDVYEAIRQATDRARRAMRKQTERRQTIKKNGARNQLKRNLSHA